MGKGGGTPAVFRGKKPYSSSHPVLTAPRNVINESEIIPHKLLKAKNLPRDIKSQVHSLVTPQQSLTDP